MSAWKTHYSIQICFFIVIWVLGLAACAGSNPSIPPTPTRRSALQRYLTPTPSLPLPTQIIQKTIKPSTPPPPSPTPITYKVVKGDTMLGVALRYGISLEDLQAANPEVDPRFLSVDTNLIIPLGESVPPALATPTPVQIRTEDPVCYRTSDLGAWCFFLVENILDEPLENVSARVYIVPANGGKVVEKTAYTPLNLIQPGSALPAMVYFEAPLAQDFVVGAEITSALLATGTKDRYLPANLNEKYINIDQSGLTARLEGVISIPKYDEPGAFLRLVAIAYGAKGQIVGVRQHEIAHPQGTRSNLPFSMAVFSLGPHIERVEIFHEAIPQSVSSEETPTGN